MHLSTLFPPRFESGISRIRSRTH